MKKTLAAVAVLGAFAGSAIAADVTLYGIIDTGLSYTRADTNTTEAVDAFAMNSGMNSGARVGLKGSEDLGNGLKVSFILENGFKSDTGALGAGDTLFDREATLSLGGDFGTFTAGRAGELRGGTGSLARFGGAVSPFSTGWGTYIAGHKFVTSAAATKINNMIAYTSPKFAGFDVTAQYSLGNTNEDANANADHRTMGVAARYSTGPFAATLLLDTTNLKGDAADDPMAVSFAANYDFEVAKVYGVAQYFKDSKLTDLGSIKATPYMDGFGLVLGAKVPVLGGTFLASMGFLKAEDAADEATSGDVTRYNASVGFEYPFSKRTLVYTGVGYAKQEIDALNAGGEKAKAKAKAKANGAEFALGLVHKF